MQRSDGEIIKPVKDVIPITLASLFSKEEHEPFSDEEAENRNLTRNLYGIREYVQNTGEETITINDIAGWLIFITGDEIRIVKLDSEDQRRVPLNLVKLRNEYQLILQINQFLNPHLLLPSE